MIGADIFQMLFRECCSSAGCGRPICMLADRQTTGGYTKIAVLCTPDIALAQRIPGQSVV